MEELNEQRGRPSVGAGIELEKVVAPEANAVRVGTREREAAAARITAAAVAGYLDLDEADQRLDRTWKARTAGELEELEADLPVAWLKELAAEEAARANRAGALAKEQSEFARGLRSYLLVMAVLVLVWLVSALTGGSWNFWPVWPMVGWGVAVLGGFLGLREHQAEAARDG